MLFNDECPKCHGEKMPFDVNCDNCYEFQVVVKRGCKLPMQMLLCDLGYKSSGHLEVSGYGSGNNKYYLTIEAPRCDESTIRELLKEEANGKTQKSALQS